MSTYLPEQVLDVHHWNDSLFSIKTTRDHGLRFENGQFVMIGLPGHGKPITRAYSIASANHEEHLEFFSIKVPDGPLTSRLQHVKEGDALLVSRKPTGTLVIRDLRPGRRLFLLATGTGLAPFLAVIKDPETYVRFEQVVLVHGVRRSNELAYSDYIRRDLPGHEFLGEAIRMQLTYYPTVTREVSRNRGRLTDLIRSDSLFDELAIPPLDPMTDRAMLCGNPAMLRDASTLLDSRGFQISPRVGEAGDYVVERAFVER